VPSYEWNGEINVLQTNSLVAIPAKADVIKPYIVCVCTKAIVFLTALFIFPGCSSFEARLKVWQDEVKWDDMQQAVALLHAFRHIAKRLL
jgi:uncharacterized membrane protein